MVKKSSFLDKIVNRFRSGSVRVDKGLNRRSRGGSGQADNVTSQVVKSGPEEIVPDSRRKLSKQEDAALAMNTSFGELASLLRGVQVRTEDQGGRLEQMSGDLSKLPATAEAQLEVLRSLVAQLEKQNTMNGKMVETFAELPDVMKGVQESLAKSAATDERTAQTLDEFKSNMNHIHSSMGDMVETNKVHADAARTLTDDHKETARQLETTTQDGLKALRWAHEDQANRISKLVGENGKWNRLIFVSLIFGVAALLSILLALLYSQ